jgi:5-methylcytosine-specific restriction endonuclease McrA
MNSEIMDLDNKDLTELFRLANEIGNKHYHRLTNTDFQEYLRYNVWRYIQGKYECGTTEESKQWVKTNSDHKCPVCQNRYNLGNTKTIDHKLPRCQYPWLSMNFANFWVICQNCNRKKKDLNWLEYERYILVTDAANYHRISQERPIKLLQGLQQSDLN